MLKAVLISERVDPVDKRARLVKLTPEGNTLLTRLNILFDEIASLVLNAVHGDDKVAMGAALSGIVNKHNSIANEGRAKSIEAMENVIQPLLKELNNDTKQPLNDVILTFYPIWFKRLFFKTLASIVLYPLHLGKL
jgi:DNA-binding MarR family transcriptional regulator